MITALILGVSVVGLSNVYTVTARAIAMSKARETASRIASGRIERLTTAPYDELPSCAGTVGCKADWNLARPELTSGGSYPCTEYVDARGRWSADKSGWRVDTVIEPLSLGNQASAASLVTVSVCFADAGGRVEQVMVQRLSVEEE